MAETVKIKAHREPLIHITKRDDLPGWKSFLHQVLGIALSFVLCGIILSLFTGLGTFEVYKKMFEGTYGGEVTMMQSFHHAAILLCISLALTPAFKMKFWNIGAEGQILMGALTAAFCMIHYGPLLNDATLYILMFAACTVSGIIWAVIPAIFKAYWNTNETLFTLMMNYIAMQFVLYFLAITDKSGHSSLGMINDRTQYGYLPEVFGKPYWFNIIVVTVIFIIMALYLRYSKQGYEISVVGESENTAKYIGINVKKVIIRTMMISGAICGITGLLIVAGDQHGLNESIAGGMGFTAIMVSWMAKFNPFAMAFISLLIVFLGDGGKSATSALGADNSIGDVLTGMVIFFIIGFEFFSRYKVNFRSKKGGARK